MRKIFVKIPSIHSFVRPHWPRRAVASTTFHLSTIGGAFRASAEPQCSGLNVCVPPKLSRDEIFLQCDGIWGGGVLRGD